MQPATPCPYANLCPIPECSSCEVVTTYGPLLSGVRSRFTLRSIPFVAMRLPDQVGQDEAKTRHGLQSSTVVIIRCRLLFAPSDHRSAVMLSVFPSDMSNAPEAPDTAGLLRYLRTFSRVSRARRLTTRRTATYAHIWDCFEKTQPFLIHASKLAKEGTLEMLFKETRITDVYLDLILEDDFFMEQQVRRISIQASCLAHIL